ncbi:hypothetical protein GKC56_05830 [Neisseriaceae bacterium PsAf]|nr:hypothetical protein [Neisseriaceae bacterium PsAf]
MDDNILKVNVFFDGTANNQLNSEIKDKNSFSYKVTPSNIALLYQNIQANQTSELNIYVEGVGTKAGEEDSLIGCLLGTGKSGIVSKAEKTFLEIQKQYLKQLKLKAPSKISLNVFGFSRGAAAARYFAYVAKTKPENFVGWKLTSDDVNINFVGLFDTVPGYVALYDESEHPAKNLLELLGDFNQDATLGLNTLLNNLTQESTTEKLNQELGSIADHVFQITAKNEYRIGFAVTNIDSSLENKTGYELVMPGSHTDIGGSFIFSNQETFKYTQYSYDPDGEPRLVNHLKQWLVENNWYQDEELASTSENVQSFPGGCITTLKGSRTLESNEYHKISLHIMAKIANEFMGNCFNLLGKEFRIDNNEIRNQLDWFVKGSFKKENWGHQIELDFPDQETSQKFARKFLHFSADGVFPFVSSALLDIITGAPKRIINKG